jgi:hypothetical protein
MLPKHTHTNTCKVDQKAVVIPRLRHILIKAQLRVIWQSLLLL